MNFLIQLMVLAVLAAMLWLLIKVIRCVQCNRFTVVINLTGVEVVDNTIVLPGTAIATAVITNNGVPIDPPAVFDADPQWVVNDPTIISFSATGVQTGLVTALAAGQTTLDVDGFYQGIPVHGTALVTVTGQPNNFAVDITWQNNPNVAAARG